MFGGLAVGFAELLKPSAKAQGRARDHKKISRRRRIDVRRPR
jgi:hypothetical protein